jgi:hypothetical protein
MAKSDILTDELLKLFMKELGTLIEAYQIIFWLSDNLIRFFEHVNWLLYLIVLDFLSFNLSCLN